MRVSYNDAMLFLAIMNSLPAQILGDDTDVMVVEEEEVSDQQSSSDGRDSIDVNSLKRKRRQGEFTNCQ